jgi:hypothetical protein
MKFPSDAQNTSTNPLTLNSILPALPSGSLVDTLVLPLAMTQTSPESAEVQRERLRRTLDFAIAIIDSSDFDPIESSMAHPQLPQ